MQERIMTPGQVAEILQIHQYTVLKFIKEGKLKASKLGRVYRIRESDLENFLEQTASKSSKVTESINKVQKKSKNKNKILKNNSESETNVSKVERLIRTNKVEEIKSSSEKTDIEEGDEYYVLQ